MIARSRVRLIRQTEASECGLASLTMIANFHGLNTDMGAMRRRFAMSMRGASLRTLISISDHLGLSARAVRLPLAELRNLQVPAVLHWNMNHFVVLERVAGDKALIHNPDGRSSWMPLAEVSDHFTGVALELRPGDRFERRTERTRLRLSGLWRNITGLRRAIVQTLVLSLILQAFVMASPYYMQVAIDSALPALDGDLLVVLAVGFGLFAVINAGAALLRALVLLSAGSSVGFGIAVNVARRLLRLPVDWFERRHTGDILSRFQSIGPIQKLLTEGAVASIVDGALAVATLTVMIFYSPLLALIAVLAFLAYTGVRLLLFSFQREAQEASIVAIGKEQTTLIETLRGITTLRLFDQEMMRHALWQTRRVDAVNADVRLARVGIWTGVANVLIFGIENVLTVWIAVGLVMKGGGFSLGMVFAYMAYKAQFIQKVGSLTDQLIQFRMIGLHLQRLSDIALSDEDPSFGPSAAVETPLEGRVELRNVHYRYSPSDPVVLKGVCLTVEPGEHVAITGPSGGGKSTLVKVILGLVEPDDGELLVDGLPLRRFGHKSYHRQIAAVLQDDSLFAGSLADNIALFDDHLDMERVTRAGRSASIHDDIMQMPMQYETLVGDMGSTLSGGQKQRVLLARALYRAPRVLIMDEGTAHLDSAHEAAVNRELSTLGITRIVVAHRKETIAAADRVLILDRGRFIVGDQPGEESVGSGGGS